MFKIKENSIGLFIDTATELGTIALYKGSELLFEKELSDNYRHLQQLHPMIKKMLSDNSISIKEIDYFGVDIGPGSFTGIRIGVSAARTLAQLLNKPICGKISLDILAQYSQNHDQLICSILDGYKQKVFASFYHRKNNILEKLSPYYDVSAEELLHHIEKYSKNHKTVYFIGSGQEKYSEILKQSTIKPILSGKESFYPLAKNIFRCINQNDFEDDYEKIIPFYLRKSDAEENLKK